jgi:hypothetical protein
MTPSSGFWRTTNDSMSFLRCLQPAHCTENGCALNRYGVLCALCLPGYKAASFGAGACEPCPVDKSSLTEAVLIALLLVAILIGMCIAVWRLDASQASAALSKDQMFVLHPADMIDLLGTEGESTTEESANTPSFQFNIKIILGFLQVVSGFVSLFLLLSLSCFFLVVLTKLFPFFSVVSLAFGIEVAWPSTFQVFLGYLDIVNLDLIPWESVQCLQPFNFYERMVC